MPPVSQVRAINSISRKISFTQSQLNTYFKGAHAGVNENKLLADIMDAPAEVDSLQFLTTIFTSEELTELKNALFEMNPLYKTRKPNLGSRRQNKV